MASNLKAMASNLTVMASNLRAMPFNLKAMASNLLAMASNLLAMASNLLAMASNLKAQKQIPFKFLSKRFPLVWGAFSSWPPRLNPPGAPVGHSVRIERPENIGGWRPHRVNSGESKQGALLLPWFRDPHGTRKRRDPRCSWRFR